MYAPKRLPRGGSAAVELAILLPFLLALLLGIWEIGRLTESQQLISNAAREGGRQASYGTVAAGQVQTVVKNYLTNAGLPTKNATITVTNATSPGTDPASAAQFDQLKVSVTIPVQDLRWTATSTFVGPGAVLTGESIWYSMKNKDYPSPSDPPIDY